MLRRFASLLGPGWLLAGISVGWVLGLAAPAFAQCDPVDGGVINAPENHICGSDGRFTILSQSDGSLGTSVFGGGGQSGGTSGGSCTLLGCLVQIGGGGNGCSYGYTWERAVDGGPFTSYIALTGTKQLVPYDSTGFSLGYHVLNYRRTLQSSNGAPTASSNSVTIFHYAAHRGGYIGWKPNRNDTFFDLTIPCGAVAPAIFGVVEEPARFFGTGNATPTPAFEYRWQAFYGGAWRDIQYTVNGTFFPQGLPDLDASLVNSEFNAHAELVGQEYVLKFRRLARPVGRCDFVPSELSDVTLRRPLSTPVVTTNADVGAGSLRTAVTNACDEDIVTFSPSVGGSTITLSSAIAISRNLTIKGDGANRITISGNGTTRVFTVAPGKNATLSSLDIVGVRVPSSSGAIFNQGNLSLRDMTFRDGQGGVTSFPGSTLRVLDSAFHGNDTLPPDRAQRFGGGGISAIGSTAQPTHVEVISSTFSGNHSGGGAIACQGCDLILRNSTLTNNLSDGTAGGLVTATDGSGKIPSVMLSGTVIAGNTSALTGPDIYSYGATFTSGGHNLIGSNEDAFDFHPVGTDRFGTKVLPLPANLVPIGANGGFTRTHALACASPAFDAGDPSDVSADQLGQTPFGAQRDIGAFESQQPLVRVSSGFRFETDPMNPLRVNFSDLSTGLPTTWGWNFGDGQLGAELNPSHTYAAPGRYTACLTAASACGSMAAQCDAEVLSPDVPKPVLDTQTISSKLVIDSLANVGDLRVRVDLKHTWRGDVRLTLISPSGTRVVLNQVSDDFADDIVGTFGAELKPAEPLGGFEGEPAGGTWTLEAFDAIAPDTGTLVAWGLAICEARDCVSADATDLPRQATLDTPATITLPLPAGPPIDRVRVHVDVSAFVIAGGGPVGVAVLKLELKSPTGTRITLFDGDAPLNVSRIAGTYGVDLQSLQTLEAFQGESPGGAWELIVSLRNPAFSPYGGRIDAFRLQACAAGEIQKCRPVTVCGPGFVSDGAGACVDFDECVPFFNACGGGTACVNQPGSFSCVACVDGDGDAVCDATDNCTQVANANQRDADGDGIGSLCDADFNQDGVVNFADLATMKASFFKTGADLVTDLNGDGVVNFADLAILRKGMFKPPGPAAAP
jgi:subtilisin-like proprotein convertase family protein